MIAISDTHGCFKTLIELVKKLPDKQLVFVGDLIDRGSQSKQVVDFVIKNNHYSVMGNHEDLMTDLNSKRLWLANGGMETLRSYESGNGHYVDEFEEHKKWMEELPLVIEYKDYVISHSACFDVWNKDHQSVNFIENTLWNRNFKFHENKLPENKVNIFGHTPVKKVTKKDYYINIDTGCFFKNLGYGILTAFDMDTGKFYQQENVE